MDQKTEAVIQQISEQRAIPEGDVTEVYEEKLERVKESGLEGVEAEDRARTLLWNAFKRQQQDNTVKVEGVILGSGDRYDAVSRQRQNAIKAYQENPQKAIKEGVVAVACPPDEAGNITGGRSVVIGEKNGWAIVTFEGNDGLIQHNFAERNTDQQDAGESGVDEGWRIYPLDQREKFRSGDDNPNYGRPMQKHSWTRRCFGLFRTEDGDKIKVGRLVLRDKPSAPNPPLGEAVQFTARAQEDNQNEDELFINSTDDTEIRPNPELAESMSRTPDELIERYLDDYLYNLEGLYEHLLQADDGRQYVCVKSDVMSIDMEPTSNNTLRMELSEMHFTDSGMVDREATVWIPAWQEEYIDFAADSRVYVIGRAELQDAYDPATQSRNPDEKEAVINCQGVYADPTVKIPREDSVEEMDEEDIEFSEDEGTEEPPAQFADGGGESDW